MIDLIRVKVKAGDGGKGCVAWRHEKFYANGGPFGGDGGRGGHVYIEVDTNETTLTKLRFTHSVKAGNGEPGKIKKMHGADGEDVTIKVPLGTMVRNAETGDLLAVITNGRTSGKMYDKYQKNVLGMESLTLPSTSPANAAWSFKRLYAEWKIVREILEAGTRKQS